MWIHFISWKHRPCCSISQSCPTLQPHGLQHTRPPCPSPSPRICLNSCLSSWWCHPTISSSVVSFSFCLQALPALESSNESVLCIRWPKYWSFSFASAFPVNIQGWFPLGLTGWISLQSENLKSLLQHHSSKASILRWSAFFMVQLSYPHMTTGKTISLTRWTCVGKVMSLLFNMLSKLVKALSSKEPSAF